MRFSFYIGRVISLGCLFGLGGMLGLWAQVDSIEMAPPDTVEVDSFQIGSIGLDSAGSDSMGRDNLSASTPTQRYNSQQLDSMQANSDLAASITYKASDSIIYDMESGMLYLYNDASLTYEEFNLKANQVNLAVDEQTLYAEGTKDRDGNDVGLPEFTQDGETYRARSVAYNFESEKGRATGGRLVQDEAFILADVAKYQPDGSFHGQNGKYTSCNLDHPHYYIQSRRLKVTESQQIITGPLNLVIGDFPIPVVVPFGFIPKNLNKKGKKNGLILPQYGNAQDRGYFLRNLGYYYGINDYLDTRIDADIWTRGGWKLRGTINYDWRYNFSGNLSYSYGVLRSGEPTDTDFSRSSSWELRWTHRQPIDPTASFNASVNISSSSEFQRIISSNLSDQFTNRLQSSVSLQKRFNNLPFSFNISARHQQDLNKGTVNMQLPELNVNVNRQTPFKGVDNKYLGWLKQLGVNYNMQARNSIETLPDSLFTDVLFRPNDSLTLALTDSTFERIRAGDFYSNGMRHTASASTGIKVLNNININPNFNYTEFWYLERTQKDWDPVSQSIIETQVPSFTRGFLFNTGVNATTNFYGLYGVLGGKDSTGTRITLITFRQRFTPSLSYSYKPDFSLPSYGFFNEVQRDTLGNKIKYSIFEEGIYGGPSANESQTLSFSLSSVLEAKYKRKESDKEEETPAKGKKDEFERITIIDNMGIRASYNLAADSFQLSDITATARTSLFKKRLNINTSFSFDPYVYSVNPTEIPFSQSNGRKQNQFLFTETGQLARLTRATISLSTSFRSDEKGNRSGRSEDIDQQELQQIQRTYYEYYDFNIPWSVRLNYNFSYSRPGINKPTLSSSVNVSGDFNFTENWKVAVTTGYDMISRQATTTSINVSRPLHCWQMTFRWVPFGTRKSYSVVISARSATLNALKLSKNDFWQDRFQAL